MYYHVYGTDDQTHTEFIILVRDVTPGDREYPWSERDHSLVYERPTGGDWLASNSEYPIAICAADTVVEIDGPTLVRIKLLAGDF